MEVDGETSVVAPTDLSYVQGLTDPWKSMAEQALPPNFADQEATTRLDQLEIAVRSAFLEGILQPDSRPLYEIAGTYWKSALDLCLHMVHVASDAKENTNTVYHQMTPRKLPLLLMEDAWDALPVDQAQLFWMHYIEPSLEVHLLGETLWKSSMVCHLLFLKVCNAFLRAMERASSSDQHQWRGRVLTALAKGFSIADRSALKAWGSFHANAHEYDSEDVFQSHTTTRTVKGAKQSMNYNLYQAFWSLQSDFANPNKIQVAPFIKKVKLVLEALESATRSGGIDSSPESDAIRYLTSTSLLPTQLSTSSFRSSVLIQFLIASCHLSAESPPLAKTLTPFSTRAKKILKADNPELSRILESILTHGEVQWRQWKKNKCPVSSFAPKTTKASESKAKTGAKTNPLLQAGSLGTTSSASEDVYESLNREELRKAAQESKQSIPSLESHLEDYVEALDPESGIEAEYHPGNDALFAWRAMRLYAKHQLPLLKNCRQPKDLERITREWYVAQGKPIPGEMPALSDHDYDEKEEEEEEEKEDQTSQDAIKEDTDMQDAEAELESETKANDEAAEEEEKDDEPKDTTADTDEEEDADDVDDEKGNTETKEMDEEGDDKDDEDMKDTEDNEKEAEGKATDSPKTPKATSDSKPAASPASKAKSDESAKKNDTSKGKDQKVVDKEPPKEKQGSKEPSQERGEAKKDNDRPRGRRDSNRKRKRSRSEEQELDRGKNPRAPPPPRDGGGDRGMDRERSRSGYRGGDRRDEGGRRDSGSRRDDGGRRDDSRRDGGRRDDRDRGPPPRGASGRSTSGGGGPRGPPRAEGGPGRNDRRYDDGPTRGGRGGDRREERPRGGGGDRRGGGRDDSRFRGRR